MARTFDTSFEYEVHVSLNNVDFIFSEDNRADVVMCLQNILTKNQHTDSNVFISVLFLPNQLPSIVLNNRSALISSTENVRFVFFSNK